MRESYHDDFKKMNIDRFELEQHSKIPEIGRAGLQKIVKLKLALLRTFNILDRHVLLDDSNSKV